MGGGNFESWMLQTRYWKVSSWGPLWGSGVRFFSGPVVFILENLSWVQGTPPSVGRDLNVNPVADLGASFVGLQGSWALLKQFFLEDSAVLFLPLDVHPSLLLPGSLGV